MQDNRDKWPKYNKPTAWGELIYGYLEKLNFGKISNLIYFENNNLNDFFKKKKNLENLNYQNTWNNVNENLLKIINEN